jgi:hypothetical protein
VQESKHRRDVGFPGNFFPSGVIKRGVLEICPFLDDKNDELI